MLKGRVDGDLDVKAGIDQARREIAASLAELREIARGLHPAVVSGHGLAVALEQLAARAGAGGAEGRRQGRLPEPLEVAAYYVVAESLANVAKHAQADVASVDVLTRRVSWWWRSWTTASAEPTVSEARASAVSRIGSRRSTGACASGRRTAAVPREGGHPVRVAIAEDSVLLREGVARVWTTPASTSSPNAITRTTFSARSRLPARRRDPGHPAAPDAQRRGAPGGARAPIQLPAGGRSRPLPVRRGRARSEAAGRLGRGRRYLLKDRIGDVEDFVASVRRVADGGSALDPIIVSTCSHASGRTIRSPRSRRASARCSS